MKMLVRQELKFPCQRRGRNEAFKEIHGLKSHCQYQYLKLKQTQLKKNILVVVITIVVPVKLVKLNYVSYVGENNLIRKYQLEN